MRHRFPFSDDMHNRWVSLGLWLISLTLAALSPYATASGWLDPLLILILGFIAMFATLITTLIVVFSFRRTLANAFAFACCLVAIMLVLPLTQLDIISSSVAPLPVQSLHTFLLVIVLDLIFAVILIAGWWGWYRQGGWVLLALTPVLWVWLPVVIARLTSPAQVVDAFVGLNPLTVWFNALMTLTCVTLPIALLATTLKLLLNTAREINAS